MDKSFFSIFKVFFKVGVLLLGGGYVILPLLQSELVEKKRWISSDELCEYYAISTSLPGIIAANIAVFTGRKLLKTRGAIAAILGVTMPAFIIIILLASILVEISEFKPVSSVFWGVGIGVIVLLFSAVREMWNKCIVDKYTFILFLICLFLALSGKISPVQIVILVVLSAIVRQFVINKKEKSSG